ncbi:H-type lectin domain-containing protein [Aestuariibius insulae]|uniref:H-type lectin domain-containing protein n=1 Tax=Aestuariibius insulae TaxID=2058287 RepID=UPI00345EB625
MSMSHILVHPIGVDQGEEILFSHFEKDGKMWTEKGQRQVKRYIKFSEQFNDPPVVQAHIVMWDISSTANSRVDLVTENVTKSGFDVLFKTWGNTQIARVRIGWIAIGSLSDHEQEALYDI